MQSPVVRPTTNLLDRYYGVGAGDQEIFRVTGEGGIELSKDATWQRPPTNWPTGITVTHDFCWLGLFKLNALGEMLVSPKSVWAKVVKEVEAQFGQLKKNAHYEVAVYRVKSYTKKYLAASHWDLMVSFARKKPKFVVQSQL